MIAVDKCVAGGYALYLNELAMFTTSMLSISTDDNTGTGDATMT